MIKRICDKYKITNYTINSDSSINVDGNVYMVNRKLTKIPLKFKIVFGDFNCGDNCLTSLENCPVHVSGDFICDNNKLSNLKYAPLFVGNLFDCCYNSLQTLDGCSTYIGGDFYFMKNNYSKRQQISFVNVNGTIFGHDNKWLF